MPEIGDKLTKNHRIRNIKVERFFIRKCNSTRNNQRLDAKLNVSLLMLINLFTVFKIADHFSLLPLVSGIFKRYSSILTILLFGLLIFFNSLFRNKAELNNCLNQTFENNNDKWVYTYLVITLASFLLTILLL
jgi:hypothetical protein